MIRFQTDIDFSRVLDQHDEYMVPLARVREMLLDRQIDIDAREGDFILADSDRGPIATDRPIVMVDRSDGGFLYWRFLQDAHDADQWMKKALLAGVIKISRYTSVETYNALIADQSEHSSRIAQREPGHSTVQPMSDRNRFTSDEFDKLLTGPGYWAFDQCGPLAMNGGRESKQRTIDVFCAVTVDYTCPIISWHRREALNRLEQISGLQIVLGRGRIYSVDTFQDLMRRCRICVSPWGWGETCHRDYEALLAGCVLIKPRTDFIDSWLPLDDRHYVACEPDFSDLEQRIRDVLDDWPRFAAHREELRSYVQQARSLDAQADLWASTLRSAISPYLA